MDWTKNIGKNLIKTVDLFIDNKKVASYKDKKESSTNSKN